MRVITGIARGRKLKTPEGMDVRPTTEGVKEAIFSAIQFEIEGRVALDLFAGTGQLGIEALSRGAKKCYFVDNSPASVKIVKENIHSTGFDDAASVHSVPNSVFLKGLSEKIDIALLDPPYKHNLIQKSLPKLADCMSDNGVIVCEHEKNCGLPEEFGGFVVSKVYHHGQTEITIYRKQTEEE